MEPKRIKRGSIRLGLFINLLSLTLIVVVSIYHLHMDYSNQFNLLGVFCMLTNVLLFFAFLKSFFVLYNGIMIQKTKKKGEEESGEIISLWVEKKRILKKNIYFYLVRYHYLDRNGDTYERVEKLSFDEFELLHYSQMIPLLIYNDRAIFNKKSFIINKKNR